MLKSPLLIIASGFPATGKTTLAKKLSAHFHLPLVSGDEFKEMMFDRIGNWEDEKLVDSVGKASYDVMYYTVGLILSAGQSCIMEAFLRPEMAEPKIAELKERYHCQIIQFQLHTEVSKLIERYESRRNSKERHPCHPGNIPKKAFVKLNGKSDLVRVDGETITLDMTDFDKIDWEMIFGKVNKLM